MRKRRSQLLALMLSAAMVVPSASTAMPVYAEENMLFEEISEEQVQEDVFAEDDADEQQELSAEEDLLNEELPEFAEFETDFIEVQEETQDQADDTEEELADGLIEAEENDEDTEVEKGFTFDADSITNNTGMFKVVAARYDGENLIFTLSGGGYRELFIGTYEQAVANGAQTDNWLHGAVNEEGKWEFSLKLEEGKSYYPLVAISNSYYGKYQKGQNSLERAFYPRQIEVDLENRTLTAGDYDNTEALTVVNNIKMFKPGSATLHTVGGPNSNNYKVDMTLTMGSASYDKMFVGTCEEAAKAAEVLALTEQAFTVSAAKFGSVGSPISIMDQDAVVCFHSKKQDKWYERTMRIDTAANTVTFSNHDADYTAVDEALATVPEDLSKYTDDSVAAVTAATEAVERGLFASQQETVDAMARAISDAVAALTVKMADYTAVDAALAKIPEDLSIYTTETVKVVEAVKTKANRAAFRKYTIEKQAEVDAVAVEVENAVAALKEIPAEERDQLAETKELIAALPTTAETTENDREAIEKAQAAYDALSEETKKELDLNNPAGSGQPYSRVLESAVWGLEILKTTDNTTVLPAGTYTADTTPALSSSSSTGKSTSSRGRKWQWDSVTVDEEGKATAVLSVDSGSMTSVRIGGKEYKPSSVTGSGSRKRSTFNDIPVDLNSIMYLAGVSSTMGTEIAYSITNTIDESLADYAAVDTALASVPEDLSKYTEETAAAVTAAVEAVDRKKLPAEQEAVDAMAKAINDAVAALVEKPVETEKPFETEKPAETEKKSEVGSKVTVGAQTYEMNADNTLTYAGPAKNNVASVNVPDSVTVEGKTYPVTEIKANAFKNNKKLTKVTIGKNIVKIGANAFAGCKALKKVTINSAKLKSIGKNAFKKAGSKNYKKLKVRAPKKQLKQYKKMLKKAKLSSKAKISK